jgi:hypothetical protein
MYKYLLCLIAALPLHGWAGQTKVNTDIGLMSVNIEAATVVNADARVLWDTLTDYNKLANFVPGMTVSRQISAPRSAVKVVEQKGEGGLLALVLPDHVILELRETPHNRITFKSVSGFVTSMRGEWVIDNSRTPLILGYRARVVPALPPPPMLTDEYVQKEIGLRLEAVAREAERRMRER